MRLSNFACAALAAACLIPAPAASRQVVAVPTSARAQPPLPAHSPNVGPTLPDTGLPAGTVKALLLRSWNGGGASAWSQLNAEWPQYGTTPIVIDHTSLAGAQSFSFADLEASGADVIVLSDPAGGLQQYTPAEVDAVRRYASGGHNVIGTYLVFQWDAYKNNALASVFGLDGKSRYATTPTTISNDFQVLIPTGLTQDLGSGWTSIGYPYSQLPLDQSPWGMPHLGSALPVAQCDALDAVVTLYEAPTYSAIYISNMPEYFGGSDDKQLLYNAITYSRP
jgi:hypothetical protein